MDGVAVSCPGCKQFLALPVMDEHSFVIGVSEVSYKKTKKKTNSKHHKKRKIFIQHQWDSNKKEQAGKGVKLLLPMVIISLILVGGISYVMMPNNNDSKKFERTENLDFIQGAQKLDSEPAAAAEYSYDPKDKAKVAQLEEFFRAMYKSKKIDDLLPYVIPKEGIREKMVKFYKGDQLKLAGFKELNFAQSMPEKKGYLIFKCQTEDYKSQEGFLSYSKDIILLDWESFVGFSEATWDELAKNKPIKPVRLRVTAKQSGYYNDDFASEKEWQSVSLSSPNEEDSIFGYVNRGSSDFQKLFNFGLSNNKKVILEVRYPEGAENGNQVLIDSVVEQSWLSTEK